MLRALYLGVFLMLSAAAGFFYYSHTREVTAVVATEDLKLGARVLDSDVAIRQVNPASVGDDLLTSPDQAIGQYVAFPVLKGELLSARHLSASKNPSLLPPGLDVPSGFRVIALPVVPAAAVGGALKAGDRVDVIAIPNQVKTANPLDDTLAAPATIGKRVLVLGLRTEQGTELDSTAGGLGAAGNKPASVLLAVPESQEAGYSSAMASSTFFLALSLD